MSNSYHENRRMLQNLSKKAINEFMVDEDSILHRLTEKSLHKKTIIKDRQELLKKITRLKEEELLCLVNLSC